MIRYAVVQAEGGRPINLNPDYWRERIQNLAHTYELVPAQSVRLKGILTLLDLAQDALAPFNYDRCK